MIMTDGGSNDFKIPHNDIRKNQKNGTFAKLLNYDRDVYKAAQIEAERLRNL